VGILIPKLFLKFSKLKNQTQKTKKRHPKEQKTQKCYKEQENRKVEENRPPQKWAF